MRISFLTHGGNTFVVSDDHKNIITLSADITAGELRIGNDNADGHAFPVSNGGEVPDFDMADGFYSGAFVTEDGIEFLAATGIHVRHRKDGSGNPVGKGIISSVIDSELGYVTLLERIERLEDKLYDYANEVGELRATRFYDGMGVFNNAEIPEENNEEEENT